MRSILPLKGEVQPSEHSERPQYPSDPGMVWFEDVKPDAEFYRKGLTTEIYEKDLPTATKSWGGHGKIGATLAVHWPAKRSTYEAIAWRVSENNGKRRLDKEAIKFIDEMDGTFLCRDQRSGSSMVAPRGKSPVLFGVRAWNKQAAEEALQRLITGADTEAVAGWMVFETNQATNDHLETATEATIEEIEILKGGHTLLHSSEDRFLRSKKQEKSLRRVNACNQVTSFDAKGCEHLMNRFTSNLCKSDTSYQNEDVLCVLHAQSPDFDGEKSRITLQKMRAESQRCLGRNAAYVAEESMDSATSIFS